MPEVRRLLLALVEPPERFSFRLAWSNFRRRHQGVAQRCHAARRERQRAVRPVVSCMVEILPASAHLTDAQWTRLVPLLPPQKPPTGRPMLDHRRIVAGMLWVTATGASWRQLPERFGPWQTVYSRYQRWCKAGIWQRVVDALGAADA